MRLAGHVARTKEIRSAWKYRKHEGKRPLANYEVSLTNIHRPTRRMIRNLKQLKVR
jgi:hypothetical protein